MTPGKTPLVATVETTTEGKPVRLKLRRVTNFRASSSQGATNAASIETALSSAMAFSVSPASPKQCARTRWSTSCQEQERLGREPLTGSTTPSATSRPPSQRPTVPATASMFRATSRIRIPFQLDRSGGYDLVLTLFGAARDLRTRQTSQSERMAAFGTAPLCPGTARMGAVRPFSASTAELRHRYEKTVQNFLAAVGERHGVHRRMPLRCSERSIRASMRWRPDSGDIIR